MLSEFFSTLGDFDSAGAIWAETVRTAEETEQPHTVAWSVMSLGFVAAIREGEEEARRHVEHALELEKPLWFMGIEGQAWPLATAALARGDGATAAAVLADTDLEICQTNYAPMTMGADLVEAHVRTGQPALAQEALAALEPHAHQPWARAALDRARGMVADDNGFDALLVAVGGRIRRAWRGLRGGTQSPLPRRATATRRPPRRGPSATACGAPAVRGHVLHALGGADGA